MLKGPFLPSDFIATKFSNAADKAEFGNTLLRFIESEWAPALFTKSFYNRLSMCFVLIAHYVESGQIASLSRRFLTGAAYVKSIQETVGQNSFQLARAQVFYFMYLLLSQ